MSTSTTSMDQLQGEHDYNIIDFAYFNMLHNYYTSCDMITVMVLCRFYVGQMPHVLIADVDMLKQLLVKDFDNFMDQTVSQL